VTIARVKTSVNGAGQTLSKDDNVRCKRLGLGVDPDTDLTIKTHAGYTGSATRKETAAGTTFDATPLTIWTLSLPDNRAAWIRAMVVGHSSDNGQWCCLQQKAIVTVTTGTATVRGQIQTVIGRSTITLNATLAASGSDVVLQVTGLQETSLIWTATLYWQPVAESN
jgi:hypothetical protein